MNKLQIPIKDLGEVSDGYHTFNELYEHRITLYIALCKNLTERYDKLAYPVWRSKLHSDGSKFDGWFILGIDKEKGKQITYHLPLTTGKGIDLCSLWEQCNFAEQLDKAPEFDGHTSKDVLERLKTLK